MEFIATQMHPFSGKRSQVRPQPTCPNPCPCPSVSVLVPLSMSLSPPTLKCSLSLNCTVVLCRGLATIELEIHPVPAHTHAVSPRSHCVCGSSPYPSLPLATEFLLRVNGRQCSSCRETTSKCTYTEKNGDSQRYVCTGEKILFLL